MRKRNIPLAKITQHQQLDTIITLGPRVDHDSATRERVITPIAVDSGLHRRTRSPVAVYGVTPSFALKSTDSDE